MREDYLALFPVLREIQNEDWRQAACGIYETMLQRSGWAQLEDVPFHPDPVKGMLLHHLQLVTKIAVAPGETIREEYGVPVDMDVLILSAMMHDLSKPNEFSPRAGGYGKSKLAYLYQHGVLGAHIALEKGFPPEIVSIIISHTRQSNFDVKSLEGVLVVHADDIAAGVYNPYLPLEEKEC